MRLFCKKVLRSQYNSSKTLFDLTLWNMNRFHDFFVMNISEIRMVWKSNYSVTCGSQPVNMEIFCQKPLAVKPPKSDGVVRIKCVSHWCAKCSANKRFLGNLSYSYNLRDHLRVTIRQISEKPFISRAFRAAMSRVFVLHPGYGRALSGERSEEELKILVTPRKVRESFLCYSWS